jgi:hypothetical protein
MVKSLSALPGCSLEDNVGVQVSMPRMRVFSRCHWTGWSKIDCEFVTFKNWRRSPGEGKFTTSAVDLSRWTIPKADQDLDEKFSAMQQLAVSQNTSPANCITPDLDWQAVCRSTCGARNVHFKNGGREPQPSSPRPELHACG